MKKNKVFITFALLLSCLTVTSCSLKKAPSNYGSSEEEPSVQEPTSEVVSSEEPSEEVSSEDPSEEPSSEEVTSVTGETNVPTTGYALCINGTNYVSLTKNDQYSGEGEEWYALGVVLNAGDVVTMYNGDAGQAWEIKTPDSYSVGFDTGAWTGGDNGITCNVAGTYDVYCKLIYENDNIYFGAPQA